MKIYKNEAGEIIIDGENATVTFPEDKNYSGIQDAIINQLPDHSANIIFTNFKFEFKNQ